MHMRTFYLCMLGGVKPLHAVEESYLRVVVQSFSMYVGEVMQVKHLIVPYIFFDLFVYVCWVKSCKWSDIFSDLFVYVCWVKSVKKFILFVL